MIRENDIKNVTGSVNLSRRKVLLTGAKYAALVPASTVLVAKSARAGGSATFTFPSGNVATTEFECFTQFNAAGGDTLADIGDCLDFL
jgi:hypothetical protein